MRWPDERDRELLDALMAMAEVAVLSTRGPRVPATAVEFLEDLSEQVVSGTGHAGESPGSLDLVSRGQTPEQAGDAVGLSGRQVRRLCVAGHVRHERIGTRYAVDVDDLRRHMSGGAA